MKNKDFYFDNFINSMQVSCEASLLLLDILTHYDYNDIQDKLKVMHDIEHKGDATRHELIKELVKAFITPIERDDMIALSQSIDNVTDAIEDILIHIYINEIKVIREEGILYAQLLKKCCYTACEMLREFKNFKKSASLQGLIIELNRLEEEGDRLYIESMRTLHETEKDVFSFIAWREILTVFEKCCDACEDVADIVEGIAIENT